MGYNTIKGFQIIKEKKSLNSCVFFSLKGTPYLFILHVRSFAIYKHLRGFNANSFNNRKITYEILV